MSTSIGGTTGITFPDASTQNTAATGFGFKNRIINGAMEINQRNNPGPLSSTESYTMDRWCGIDTTSGGLYITQQTSSVPSGFNYALESFTTSQATSITGSEYAWIGQKIEGYNIKDLAFGTSSAQPITLSFWVRSSLTGNFSGSIQNLDRTRSYVFSYTISSANTWENKSITISGDTTGTWNGFNATGLQVLFSLGAASSYCTSSGSWTAGTYYAATGQVNVVSTLGSSFYITGVQLEKGSTATSFDYRPYGTELALCQRYYYRLVPDAANRSVTTSLWTVSAVGGLGTTVFPVPMRTAPTALEQSGTLTDYQVVTGGVSRAISSAVLFNVLGNSNFGVTQTTVASGQTAGQAGDLRAQTTNGYLAWSAEL